MLYAFRHNLIHNFFKQVLLFFCVDFISPLQKIFLEFPLTRYRKFTRDLPVPNRSHGGGESASRLGTGIKEAAEGFGDQMTETQTSCRLVA